MQHLPGSFSASGLEDAPMSAPLPCQLHRGVAEAWRPEGILPTVHDTCI